MLRWRRRLTLSSLTERRIQLAGPPCLHRARLTSSRVCPQLHCCQHALCRWHGGIRAGRLVRKTLELPMDAQLWFPGGAKYRTRTVHGWVVQSLGVATNRQSSGPASAHSVSRSAHRLWIVGHGFPRFPQTTKRKLCNFFRTMKDNLTWWNSGNCKNVGVGTVSPDPSVSKRTVGTRVNSLIIRLELNKWWSWWAAVL